MQFWARGRNKTGARTRANTATLPSLVFLQRCWPSLRSEMAALNDWLGFSVPSIDPFEEKSDNSQTSTPPHLSPLDLLTIEFSDLPESMDSPLSQEEPQILDIRRKRDTSPKRRRSPGHSSDSDSGPTTKRKGATSQRDPIPGGDAATLPRQTILTISSPDFEKFAGDLRARRTLTPAEEKELKRQRRLVRNREYAQESRNKKRSVENQLEAKLTQLESANARLQRELDSVRAENAVLKQQLASEPRTSWELGVTSQTTFTLFVVLFAFGLIFSLGNIVAPVSSSHTYHTGRSILTVESPEVNWFQHLFNHLLPSTAFPDQCLSLHEQVMTCLQSHLA